MRWTEAEATYSRKKNRIFNFIPELIPTVADLEPLYSSFNPNGVFQAPPNSKEALQRQLQKIDKEENRNTSDSQNVFPESTGKQILEHAKINFFKRVKSAYR